MLVYIKKIKIRYPSKLWKNFDVMKKLSMQFSSVKSPVLFANGNIYGYKLLFHGVIGGAFKNKIISTNLNINLKASKFT